MYFQKAVKYVIPFWKKNDLEGACNFLIETAVKQWDLQSNSRDDITCIIIFLNPYGFRS